MTKKKRTRLLQEVIHCAIVCKHAVNDYGEYTHGKLVRAVNDLEEHRKKYTERLDIEKDGRNEIGIGEYVDYKYPGFPRLVK
jgi:hypothetical protein